MHGEAGRLVEDEKSRLLVQDGVPHAREQGIRNPPWSLFARRNVAHRRQADFVVCGEAIVGLLALAVDAHFSTAQQPVDAASRHAGASQKKCRALAFPGVAGAQPANAKHLIRPAVTELRNV